MFERRDFEFICQENTNSDVIVFVYIRENEFTIASDQY